jgi:hypothetical protein
MRINWEPSSFNAEYLSSLELLALLFFMTIPYMFFDIALRSKDLQISTKLLAAKVVIITIVFVGFVEYFLNNYNPWFIRPYSWFDYWFFYEGIARIPAAITLAFFMYVIVPLVVREKNRLQQIVEKLSRRDDIKDGLFNRIKQHSPKLLIVFLFVILFLFPSVVLYGSNYYSFDLSFSSNLFSFNYLFEGISRVDEWYSFYIEIPSIMIVLYPNLLRILFTHRLLLWRRGKSSRHSAIVLGIIGEIWAYYFAPMSIPQENLWFDFDRTFVSIPILFIFGLLVLVRSKRYPVVETEFDSVFLIETSIVPEQTIIWQSGMEEFVEVPFAYSFTSRLKNSRLNFFKEIQALEDEE